MAAEKMTNGDAANASAHDAPGAGPADACEQRYPDYLMDFAPDLSPEQVQHWRRFFDLREDILLDYGYQTARAYWTDLQDIFEWAVARDKKSWPSPIATCASTAPCCAGASTAKPPSDAEWWPGGRWRRR